MTPTADAMNGKPVASRDLCEVPPKLVKAFLKLPSCISLGGRAWKAPCPCHDDRAMNLLLTADAEGNLAARCSAGCNRPSLSKALGVPVGEIPPERKGQKGQKGQKGHEEPPQFEPKVVCVEDVQIVKVPWLWGHRIPLGRLTLFVGRPGGGKSFLSMWIAAQVSTGREFPDKCYGVLGDVVVLNAEDDVADTVKPRLVACEADCKRVHVLQAAQYTDAEGKKVERCVTLADIPILEKVLQGLSDPKLVIIDPVGSHLGGKTDAHRDNEVRAVLAPLADLASRYNVAVILIAHTRKSAADSADDMALGSRAFTGICRAVWHLSRDTEDKDRRLFLAGKCNLARPRDGLAFRILGDGDEPGRVEFEDGEVAMSADDALANEAKSAAAKRKPGPKPDKRADAEAWLEAQLSSGPKAVAELQEKAAKAEHSWSTVQRARRDMCVEISKNQFAGGSFWNLPGDDVDASEVDASKGAGNVTSWHDSEKRGEKTLFEPDTNGSVSSSEELDTDPHEAPAEPVAPVVADPTPTKKKRVYKATKSGKDAKGGGA